MIIYTSRIDNNKALIIRNFKFKYDFIDLYVKINHLKYASTERNPNDLRVYVIVTFQETAKIPKTSKLCSLVKRFSRSMPYLTSQR